MEQWKADLANLFQDVAQEQKKTEEQLSLTKAEASDFYATVVGPAFEELRAELEKHGRKVDVTVNSRRASIVVTHDGIQEMDYSVMVRTHPGRVFPYPETRFTSTSDGRNYRSEGYFRSGLQDYTIKDITKEEIIKHFLGDYRASIKDRARRR